MSKMLALKSAFIVGALFAASSAIAQVSGITGTAGRGIDTAAATTSGGGANPTLALNKRPKGGNAISGVRDFFAAKNKAAK